MFVCLFLYLFFFFFAGSDNTFTCGRVSFNDYSIRPLFSINLNCYQAKSVKVAPVRDSTLLVGISPSNNQCKKEKERERKKKKEKEREKVKF